jgi:hypothetical protein
LKRRIILAAGAVTAVLALPAAASAATPGHTPTGVSEGTGEVQQGTVQTPACGAQGIALVQNDSTLRWSLAPVDLTQARHLLQIPIDPPAKEQDETETEDRMQERDELMDRLLDMLNRFNRTRDAVAGGIG